MRYLLLDVMSPSNKRKVLLQPAWTAHNKMLLWVNRAGTATNLRQQQTFSDISNYLAEKMDDLIQEKPNVS
jgi:hypothetical protein